MSNGDASRSYLQRVLAAVGVATLAFAVLYLFWSFANVLLVVFAGVLAAIFLGGLARKLSHRLPFSRNQTLGLIILVLIGVAASIIILAGPPLAAQAAELAKQLPEALNRLQGWLQKNPWADQIVGKAPDFAELLPAPTDLLGGVTNLFSTTFGLLANLFLIVVVGIYGAINPSAYVNSAVRLVPPARRQRAREVLHALGRALRWWLVGRFIMMGIVGVLTAVGLWIAGIASPLALGFIAALLAFVPYIGPILSAVPALMVAGLVSLTKVAYVVIVYGAVQLLESYLITPLVQERTVSILPAALIMAQVMMGFLAGALGVLLATPLAVSVIVLVQTLYIDSVLGEPVKVLGEHGEDDD